MLKKLLIANRGEIAIRIARTATDMGIETVAIHTPDDARSLHLKYTTEAHVLPNSGAAGYLDGAAVLAIARHTGCDSIHPGYGFLSENADFARLCAAADLIFVGPDPQTLDTQGDKLIARAFAHDQGVSVIEASGVLHTVADVTAFFAAQNGAPIMLKAVNGGGGRGMRVVRAADEIEPAFTQCQAEALAAFGDDTLYGERFLPNVRHIEVQIIGDGSHVAHLWDRDCSLQRRNQKIVELAPAHGLDPVMRQAMLDGAVKIGTASGYKGLGTVEFLVTPDAHPEYFFIETNPRLQVEHTVTEEITGLDLVEMQLRIAAGQTLVSLNISGISPNGFAVQARINCERLNADGTVTPTGGTLDAFLLPGGRGVRVDSYGYPGYRTNPGFDSLLAKLIVHSSVAHPSAVLAKAERALSEFHISGVETNIPMLRSLLSLPDVQRWNVTVATVAEALNSGALACAAPAPDRFFDRVAAETGQNRTQSDYPENISVIASPMQGQIASYEVAVGGAVRQGDVIAIIEAMKMQHEIKALAGGILSERLASVGDIVDPGQTIALVEKGGDEGAQQGVAETIDPDHIRPDLHYLFERTALTLDEQRTTAVDRRRRRGQRTARENVADLVGDGTFSEYGQFVYAAQRRRRDKADLLANSPADGIITGIGSINSDLFSEADSRVAILAYDGTVMAGTQGMLGHKKTDRLLHLAIEQKLPVVFYTEGGGGRPGDEDFADTMVSGLDVMTFNLVPRLNSSKPSIAVNSGYCFAGNAAVFGACDIKIATRESWIGLGGPAMVEAGGLGAFGPKDIGPAPMQATIGLVDVLADDEAHATQLAKQILGYFQGDIAEWVAPDQRVLRHAIPENRKRVYDIRTVINGLVDTGSFLELRPDFAIGMITGFIRIQGRPFGLIANNPTHLGGAIDAAASDKAATFLRLCGRFRLPVVSLCDTPGFMVGPASEEQGGVQRACEFIGAGALLDSPLFTVVLRKGYGIGAQAMAGGSFAAPFFLISWPTGEFGAMGLEGSVELGYKRELDAEPDATARQALFDRLVASAYERGQALNVAALLEIDAVIDPKDTRDWIMNGLRTAQDRRNG